MKLPRHTPEMIERYIREGYWEETLPRHFWDRCARDYPDKEAIVDAETRMTYAQAKRWIDRVALGLLELGINRDDVIVAQLSNKVEAVLVGCAMEKVGALMARAAATLRHREMEHVLKLTEAVGVIIQPRHRDFDYYGMIQEIRPNVPSLKHIFVIGEEVPPGTISLNEMARRPLEEKFPEDRLEKTRPGIDEVSMVSVTSGTTGLPKVLVGCALQTSRFHRYLVETWKITKDDVIVALGPFYGAGGYPINCAPVVGAKVVLAERFEPEEALKLLEREKATVACGVPAQMVQMVRHPNLDKYDLSSLRSFCWGGASCPYSVAEDVEEKMGCRLIDLVGATEAGLVATNSPDEPAEVRRTSGVKVIPGVEVKLLDDKGKEVPQGEIGEMTTRGWLASSGFFNEPEATRAAWGDEPDGWLHTGDLCKFDEDGNLYIVGRAKDMIIRGAQNIYPGEVENILVTHPKVLNVAVVSMPDPIMGEKCCAYVIPRPGQGFTFDEMVSFLKDKKMASYKLPERLEIVDSFPMSGDGQKIIKRELTEDVTRKLEAEGKIP